MKKILLLLGLVLVGLSGMSFGQTTFTQEGIFTTVTAGGGILENSNVGTHTISWTVTATVSACTVQLETSSNGTSFSLMSGTAAQTCTSTGTYTFSGTTAKYVRVNFTALTTSGSGQVAWFYSGNAVPNSSPVLYDCGDTTGTTNCTNTNPGLGVRIYRGRATLASNTATITIAPGFTGATTASCVANDITTRANPVQALVGSATTIVITNTTGAADVISYICVGY